MNVFRVTSACSSMAVLCVAFLPQHTFSSGEIKDVFNWEITASVQRG